MHYGDEEYQIARREIQEKTNWSYFWAATAGITGLASVVLGLELITGVESAIGAVMTAIGGIGAGVQSYSYDRESAALHDKLEISLSKGQTDITPQLSQAINHLSNEISEMHEHQMQRSDGKNWQEFISEQRQAERSTTAQHASI